jgi:hypothetical protein
MERQIINDVVFTDRFMDREKSVLIREAKITREGVIYVELTTSYMENLPSPTYKTRQFSRVISKTLPDNISKEDFTKEAEKQAAICETLVKNDIVRHREMIAKGEDPSLQKLEVEQAPA